MNIMMICDEYPPGRHGGIGTVVQLTARTFVKMGHNVTVAGFYFWGYGGEDEFVDEGVKVYRFRQKLSSSFFERQDSLMVRGTLKLLYLAGILEWDIRNSIKEYGNFLRRLIIRNKIDIVEMPDYHDYMRFCKQVVHFPELNAPIVVKMHGSITYFGEEAGNSTPYNIRSMEQAILERADKVVSVSHYTAKKTASYLDYNKPVTVLYNGIDIPEIAPNITKNKGLVIFTGSLVEKKGIYPLMEAWNIVAARHKNAQLHIYGKGAVDKMLALLNSDAKQSVYFKGHVSRKTLYENLASAEVAVFPSFAETFGLAPVEAMVCGTAVIYSTLTSGPEIVKDHITGLLVDPGDVDAIANSILLLLEDEQLNKNLAIRGRQSIIDNFDIKIIARQNIDLYNSVLHHNEDSQR